MNLPFKKADDWLNKTVTYSRLLLYPQLTLFWIGLAAFLRRARRAETCVGWRLLAGALASCGLASAGGMAEPGPFCNGEWSLRAFCCSLMAAPPPSAEWLVGCWWAANSSALPRRTALAVVQAGSTVEAPPHGLCSAGQAHPVAQILHKPMFQFAGQMSGLWGVLEERRPPKRRSARGVMYGSCRLDVVPVFVLVSLLFSIGAGFDSRNLHLDVLWQCWPPFTTRARSTGIASLAEIWRLGFVTCFADAMASLTSGVRSPLCSPSLGGLWRISA